MPGRGNSVGQEVKESLVYGVGKGDRASSWKAGAGLRDLNFVLKAKGTY